MDLFPDEAFFIIAIALIVSVPLGLWKLVELVILLFN